MMANGMLLSEFLRMGQEALARYGDREVWLPWEEEDETEDGVSFSVSPLQEVTLAPVELDAELPAFLLLVNEEMAEEDEAEEEVTTAVG